VGRGALVIPLLGPAGLRVCPPLRALVRLGAIEGGVGRLLGLCLRMTVMALQFAGSIAAQSTALAQMAGAGVAPDPMPAIGNTLFLGGLTLAMVLGLPAKAVMGIAATYEAFGFGAELPPADIAVFGVAQAMAAFGLALSLAAPFVIGALLYNIMLGAINRAMPQLMVALVGAPAITAATLLLLFLSAPIILVVWHVRFDAILAAPGQVFP